MPKSTKAPKPAVSYIRVSTEEQALEGVSLEAQREKIETYCQLHSLDLIASHADEGLSGKSADKRPGLQAALHDACTKKAALVVYSLSRLSRNTRDALEISERLDRAKGDLVSICERIDTTSAMGKFFFTTVAALNELERSQVSERTRMAMAHKRGQGERVSRFAPFGFDFSQDGTRLVRNRREQNVIKKIVKARKAGVSYEGIAISLNEDGVAPKQGVRWHGKVVRSVILRDFEGLQLASSKPGQ